MHLRLRPRVVGVVEPPRGALALFTIPGQSAIVQWDWGFHTVRGGFDPGNNRFLPQIVGVVNILKDF